ncbi:amino acid-binding ACT protein [Intrasporangium oryzae NRRL B-24470]|uniref:Amino acid-binding ACT protein n=1 Tax=Intrasporangium oryzae NRRL B-24470 TaxID=1386089 RepID=W9G8C2_9MICO|nr:ACT domain-containing protein [Intrasporangium oryzae]EWT02461.1 amino acid-binding ACT protein [Intrasporangium oryzae NRRL B-24470]
MPRLVLTVIGDDRAGLVKALAEVVTAHGGNWEHSQMAELAGKFAGIVVVAIPAERGDDFVAALRDLEGLMEVSVHPGAEAEAGAREGWQPLTIDLLGNDHPGIVNEVTGVLTRHGLSIDTIATETRDAPMAGGRLFEAHVVALVPPTADPVALRADLEELATELLVELAVE